MILVSPISRNVDRKRSSTEPTRAFSFASSADLWGSFPSIIASECLRDGVRSVAELGGGANPLLSVSQACELGVDYTLLDVSAEELAKADSGYHKKCLDLAKPQSGERECFDLAFSRMLVEHIADPATFHANVWRMLRPGGMAIHFFPTLFAPPFLVNRLLPHRLTAPLLALLQPLRERGGKHGKFPAYYRWCQGPSARLARKFESLGFDVVAMKGGMGHSAEWTIGAGYYDRIPPMLALHRRICPLLLRWRVSLLTSFAIVILRKQSEVDILG